MSFKLIGSDNYIVSNFIEVVECKLFNEKVLIFETLEFVFVKILF